MVSVAVAQVDVHRSSNEDAELSEAGARFVRATITRTQGSDPGGVSSIWLALAGGEHSVEVNRFYG